MFNTAILGGFSKATGLVSMESIEKALRSHFKADAGEKNILGARLAYEGTMTSWAQGKACA
jgi:Pyruvate/2-oxoacid:ferredoxin oxidoreductase gamma subunit